MGRVETLPLSRVAGLLGAIGAADPRAFAGEVLHTLDPLIGAAQCTVFAYEFSNRPRTLSVADHRGGRFLAEVAEHYARLYYSLDGNQKIVTGAPPARPQPVLHRQSRDEIAHPGYRAACYERPRVGDRVSLLTPSEPGIWLAINLYRDQRQGRFSAEEMERIDAVAPVLAQAARHHYALSAPSAASAMDAPPGLPALTRARLRKAGPGLSQREFDALCGVLQGLTAKDIAERMGVAPSSVVTYQKRGYRRLGIGSQRELFALCAG